MSMQLSKLINMAVVCLEKLSLSKGTINDYRQSAFRPLERRLTGQGYVDSEHRRTFSFSSLEMVRYHGTH